MYVLDLQQYNILTQFSGHIGGVFDDFADLLADKQGFLILEKFLKSQKQGAFVADICFWRDCHEYSRAPSPEKATKIFQTYVHSDLASATTFLDFGEEMGEEIARQVDSAPQDLFEQAKEDIYRRLEQVVKPRFLASAEFSELLQIKKRQVKEPEFQVVDKPIVAKAGNQNNRVTLISAAAPETNAAGSLLPVLPDEAPLEEDDESSQSDDDKHKGSALQPSIPSPIFQQMAQPAKMGLDAETEDEGVQSMFGFDLAKPEFSVTAKEEELDDL